MFFDLDRVPFLKHFLFKLPEKFELKKKELQRIIAVLDKVEKLVVSEVLNRLQIQTDLLLRQNILGRLSKFDTQGTSSTKYNNDDKKLEIGINTPTFF